MAEEQAVGGEVVEQAPVGMDMEGAVADIADALNLTQQEEGEAPPAEGKDDAEGEAERPAVAEPEKAPPAAVDPADAPPDTWRKEAKEAWATVSPVVKEELRKREADISSYVERVKQPAAVGEKLNSIMAPYLPMFEKTGVDPWQNMEAMLRAQEMLLFGAPEQKLAMFQALAQQAGIKVEGGQLSAPEGAQAAYIQRLESRLNELAGSVKGVTAHVQEARLAELQSNVATFAQDTAAHPYFNEVADRIAHLIRNGAAANLDDAYQTAILADPIVRQKVLKDEVARAKASEAKASTERTEQARKAAKVNVRSSGRGRAVQPAGTIDDTLRDTLADINTRH